MLPQSPETVRTLASGPEDSDKHQEHPDHVTDAAHSPILGAAEGPSRLLESSLSAPITALSATSSDASEAGAAVASAAPCVAVVLYPDVPERAHSSGRVLA